MGQETSISWCHSTFNLWWGCTRVQGSPACTNCYADTWATRCGFKIWDNDQRRYFGDKHWNEPHGWDQKAALAGVRKRVFCMSMGDWAEGRPEQAPHLQRLWQLVPMTPNLDYLMLTKRPQLIKRLCPLVRSNVWHGVTAETQNWFNNRWGFLRDTESAVYWLSMEPLFERIVLPDSFLALGRRAWVIVGGESGAHFRVMDPAWVRHLRDQCVEAGVPFHFKQWSGVRPKGQGRLLDGREWNEVPGEPDA